MKHLKPSKKQIAILLIFSLLVSIAAVYTDTVSLEWIKPLGGLSVKSAFILALCGFVVLLILEMIFDINNDKKIDELSREIEEIKNKIK